MASKKLKMPTLVSPVGTLAYGWLSKPDEGKKYSDGKYKGTLVLTPGTKEVDDFVKMVEEAHAEARGNKKTDSPIKDGNDKTDKETGEIKEEFKDKILVTFKSQFQPQLLEKNREGELPVDQAPKSGDLVKFAYAMVPYAEGKNAGVSMQMRAVKLMERRARADYSDAFGDDGDDTSEDSASSKAAPAAGKKKSGGDDF